MRNRAKCKLCNSIIESFHPTDLVLCSCGEISVDGGDALRCSAKNWNHFLRIDENDKEIQVSIIDEDVKQIYKTPSKEDLLKILDDMIQNIEKLPPSAMTTPITHYDFCSALLLLSSIFRSDNNFEN